MPGGILQHPLSTRGGIAHTFGSLAGFLVVSFLCWGIYILEDALANPLDAAPGAIISGAFFTAVGVILLFYLIRPGRKPGTAPHTRATPVEEGSEPPYFVPPDGASRHADLRDNLTYQRFYVDHFRIRQ